jgi:pimeloyl-ACP methyl ester carboxylesterase
LHWGFSYGTLIGQVFAAMHPERISRFVLDGVVLPAGYFNGNWTPSIVDADATFDTFFKYCSESGLKKCPFHADGGAQNIKRHYYGLLSSLEEDPVPVPASSTRAPDVITSSDIRFGAKEALYCPLQKYPLFAQQLVDLSHRNGSLLADTKQALVKPFHLPDKCGRDGPFSLTCQEPGGWEDEVTPAIHCPDAESADGITKVSYKKYVDILTNQSMVMGYTWAEIRMPCIGWKVRPKWKYEGMYILPLCLNIQKLSAASRSSRS